MKTLLTRTPAFINLISLILIILLAVFDYITGIELSFFIFYFIPITISAWYVGQKSAIICAVLSALAWAAVDVLCGHVYPHWSYYLWNSGIRLASFLILALVVSKIKALLDLEKTLSGNLQKALDEVNLLKGFLPICASCKNIRNEKGLWEQIEQYIRNHSAAEFTHTLCPDCAKKLYPDIDLESKK
ncbi:MAG: DUF4118 domain-containing protein [Spirochaetes bacterium]|nr:DUF4118 domain-containing protein [Spirochaetota bacterium]